jgi:hypothetical protein
MKIQQQTMNTKFSKQMTVGLGLACLAPWLAWCQSTYEPYTITTIAGNGSSAGSHDGTNSAARFNWPVGVAADRAGNLYVTEWNNHTIRKVTPMGTNWVVTTLAGKAGSPGNADGTNTAARFSYPVGIVIDSAGKLYVSDVGNATIRKVMPVGTNWVVTTLAGKAGSAGSVDGTNDTARFDRTWYISVDHAGNVYVAEWRNHTIRKVAPVGTNWVVTTLAGRTGSSGSVDGTNGAARFNGPISVAVDNAGNLYVGDLFNHTIRKVTPMGTNWLVTTLAGKAGSSGSADGTNSAARFNRPGHVEVDEAGNLYVADFMNDTIRKVTPAGTNWVVTTLAGKSGSPGTVDGAGSDARFHFYDPNAGGAGGLAVDSEGTLYAAEWYNNTIRKGYRPVAIASSATDFGFTSGQFGFAVTGPAGQAVIVETSPDLTNWLPVWTNTYMVGPLQFTDPDSGVCPNRFYRARRP